MAGEAEFGRGHGHDLAPFDVYHEVRGLRWPVVDGKETLWRFREGYDPYVKKGEGFRFYGKPDGKAVVFVVPVGQAAILLREKIIAGTAPEVPIGVALDMHTNLFPAMGRLATVIAGYQTVADAREML